MCESKISIVIPTHNRKLFLKSAIDSIERMEHQNYEIIIVNDASTDDTKEYLLDLKHNDHITVINNEESKFAHGARKEGLECITGKYVVFMDDDDYYTDHSFYSNAVELLDNNPKLSCVFGSTQNIEGDRIYPPIDLGGNGIIDQFDYINLFGEKYRKPNSTLSAVFRASALRKSGLYESKMVNDTCIYLYGILGGDVGLINHPVAMYRIHGNNISSMTFSKNFIIDCLQTKYELYLKAKEKNLLTSPYAWCIRQLNTSSMYFLFSSKEKLNTFKSILIWYIPRHILSFCRLGIAILTSFKEKMINEQHKK